MNNEVNILCSSRLFPMPPPPLSSTGRRAICRRASWGPLDPSWGSPGGLDNGLWPVPPPCLGGGLEAPWKSVWDWWEASWGPLEGNLGGFSGAARGAPGASFWAPLRPRGPWGL
eukprot:2015049-Pyramimonas_sp.AAC.1